MSELKVSKKEWSTFAPVFTRFLDRGPGIHTARDILKRVDTISPLSQATTFLDIGCGPGQVTGVLVEEYGSHLPASTKIVAADLSPEMLEKVEDRKAPGIAAGHAAWERVETKIENALELGGISDASVSYVVGSAVYFLLPQHRKAMEQARRVLKNDGIFALNSIAESEWMKPVAFTRAVRPDKNFPDLAACWISIDGVKGELEATGFRDIEVFEVPSYMPFEDHQEIMEFLVGNLPPMKMLTADMTGDEIRRVIDLSVDWLKERHPIAPGRIVGRVIIGIGRK